MEFKDIRFDCKYFKGYMPCVPNKLREKVCTCDEYVPISRRIGITSNMDIIVTSVSMMMHIAIGLNKPLVLFNNIFNLNEFELYGRGVILEPSSGCDDYYGTKCTRDRHCMKDISVEDVMSAIARLS